MPSAPAEEVEMITYEKLFIGGRWADPATPDVFEVRSPHDLSPVGTVPEASRADVDRAVAAAREAFDHGPWPRMSPEERQRVVTRFNGLHAARADEIAALITAENGSAIWFTRWAPAEPEEQHPGLHPHREQVRLGDRAARRRRTPHRGAPGARRSRRHGDPVERAAPVGAGEDDPRAARRLLSRTQAVPGDGGRRPAAR
jgi:hypothetical protein